VPVDAGAIMRSALAAHGGRGGGRPEAAEGAAPAAETAAVLIESAVRAVEAAVAGDG
jgi:hypothetical protein